MRKKILQTSSQNNKGHLSDFLLKSIRFVQESPFCPFCSHYMSPLTPFPFVGSSFLLPFDLLLMPTTSEWAYLPHPPPLAYAVGAIWKSLGQGQRK
jgi:hypothetical protein